MYTIARVNRSHVKCRSAGLVGLDQRTEFAQNCLFETSAVATDSSASGR